MRQLWPPFCPFPLILPFLLPFLTANSTVMTAWLFWKPSQSIRSNKRCPANNSYKHSIRTTEISFDRTEDSVCTHIFVLLWLCDLGKALHFSALTSLDCKMGITTVLPNRAAARTELYNVHKTKTKMRTMALAC